VNDWLHWDTLRSITLKDPGNSSERKISGEGTSRKDLFEHFWLSKDILRYTYLLDRLLKTPNNNGFGNVLVIGSTGSGKSKFMNKYA
jgi:hypothetical protein